MKAEQLQPIISRGSNNSMHLDQVVVHMRVEIDTRQFITRPAFIEQA